MKKFSAIKPPFLIFWVSVFLALSLYLIGATFYYDSFFNIQAGTATRVFIALFGLFFVFITSGVLFRYRITYVIDPVGLRIKSMLNKQLNVSWSDIRDLRLLSKVEANSIWHDGYQKELEGSINETVGGYFKSHHQYRDLMKYCTLSSNQFETSMGDHRSKTFFWSRIDGRVIKLELIDGRSYLLTPRLTEPFMQETSRYLRP